MSCRVPHPLPGRARHAQRGFTLVELMIALALGLLVVGAVIAVFVSNKAAYSANAGLGRVQDTTRIAFELMARDLRQAGLTGCGNSGRISNTLKNGPLNSGTTWWADFAGNAIRGFDNTAVDNAVAIGTGTKQRVTGTDSIELIGADGAGWSLSSDTESSSTYTLNLSEGSVSPTLATGDVFIICDPDHAAIAQATLYTSGSPSAVQHSAAGTSSPGNCTTGLGYPPSCTTANFYQYAFDAQVARLYAVDWYIGNNALGGRSLFRIALVNTGGVPTPTAQEMVRNVTDMQLNYHENSGSDFHAAGSVAAWTNVDAVSITFTMQNAATTGAGVANDAGQNAGTTTGTPIQRTVTSVVTLRNRV